MNDRIKNAFDNIHAEDELKKNTIKYINGKRKTYKPLVYRMVPVAAAFVLMIGVCLFGYTIYSTPVTVLSIDINPSFELGINCFDKIVEVQGYNEDGSEFTSTLDIKHSNYKDAINKIMDSESYTDDVISITVGGKEGKQKESILSNIENISKDKENVYCDTATKEEVREAHTKGFSFGKYKAYLKLLENGYEITEEDIKDMSMKDVREKLKDGMRDDGNGKDDKDNNIRGDKDHEDDESNSSDSFENGHHGNGRN